MLLKVVKDVINRYHDTHITMDQLKDALEAAHDEIKWDNMQAVAERAVQYLAESGPGRGVKITITEDEVVIDCGKSRKSDISEIAEHLFDNLRNGSGDSLDNFDARVEGGIIVVTFPTDFDGDSDTSRKPMKAPRPHNDDDDEE